ncbi:MAG TPA: Fis family transcriptional regulator [Stellaceae bacterium]|nr:Fis family transcriptional regulator [Stellaceae bacterium]
MPKAGSSNPHIGASFDDFLDEEGIAAEITRRAVREVIAHLVIDHMEQANLTKTEMAARMHTSRQALDRLLDPNGGGLTLDTLERAANAVGKRVRISFDDVVESAA